MSATPISIASIATSAQKTEANAFLWDIFQAVISLAMTVFTIIKDFIVQPSVLSVLAFMIVIAWGYAWIKRKKASAWM